MKITEAQLRKGIRKMISEQADYKHDDAEIIDILEEMGFDLNSLISTAENELAIRDAMEAYPREFTYGDVQRAVSKRQNQRYEAGAAARYPNRARGGSYAGD